MSVSDREYNRLIEERNELRRALLLALVMIEIFNMDAPNGLTRRAARLILKTIRRVNASRAQTPEAVEEKQCALNV